MDKITETREFLIKKYGEPIEKILPDGRKYCYVNVDLNNFDNLMKLFNQLSELYKIEIKEEHISALCDFAKTGIQQNVENVVRKLNRYIKEREKKIGFGRKPFLKLLNELEEFYNDETYNPNYIMDVFVKYTGCADIRKKPNFRELM